MKRIIRRLFTMLCLVSLIVPTPVFAFDWQAHDLSHLVLVANRNVDELTIIDMTTDKVIGKQKIEMNSQAHMAMFSPDGKKLAIAATDNGLISIVNLKNNAVNNVRVGAGPEHMDISKDNRWLFVGNIEEGTVSKVDLNKNVETARFEGFREPHGATILSNKVYVPNRGAQLVGLIETDEQSSVKNIPVGSLVGLASLDRDQMGAAMHRERSFSANGVANVTLTQDEKFAYVAVGDANVVEVVDTATNQVVKTIPVGQDPWRAYASPNGKYMLTPNNGEETVSLIDVKTQSVKTTLQGGPDMTGVNFNHDGTKAYVISRGANQIYVYDLTTGSKTTQLDIGPQARLETASVSPAGKKIYVASSKDNSIYVVDMESDSFKQIANVGNFPWGVTIYKGQNYCH